MTASAEIDCLIAIGSNLGDRLGNLRAGIAGLVATDGVSVTAISPLYETAPVGGPDDQGAYYNAALRATSTRRPAELLRILHDIEAARERERTIHWGPRTLDLDLLVAGDLVSDDPTLHIPHPRMTDRRFVMVPVCDIAAEVVHPVAGEAMGTLLARLPVEPGDLRVAATTWADPESEPEWT